MNCYSLQLYIEMQDELRRLKRNCKNEMLMIEDCFNITRKYRDRISTRLETHLFRYKTEEIKFFKYTRPLFIAAMEYYSLQYQAVLFRPSADEDELILYWMQQLKRVETFYKRHEGFYKYYTRGQTEYDHIYFARPVSHNDPVAKVVPGKKCFESYQHTAALIIGYRQYRLYAERELNRLLQEVKI
ncbi:MAG TPA: RteC domain-containing protein [Ferruginibacter sp.]|nr:RteC domain-containing protein [Ferruginibacter sp.]